MVVANVGKRRNIEVATVSSKKPTMLFVVKQGLNTLELGGNEKWSDAKLSYGGG